MKIEIKNICKRFGTGFDIENLNMSIDNGEFVSFLGPSGCGKTTILRMIGGLEHPDQGEIWFDDQCMFSRDKKIDVPPERRHLGYVFQDFALWPHMTVFENIAYPLRARHETKDLENKILIALKEVHLEGFEKRYPGQLSGGQQQRVAFARALVAEPKCILFDEPLSALDALLRENMRREIKRITAAMGTTSIFVTHDQTEAMSMSDRIYVLNNGAVEQHGTPEEIYQKPKTVFTANFIGKSDWIDDKTMVRPESVSLTAFDDAQEYQINITGQNYIGNRYELLAGHDGKEWVLYSDEKMPRGETSVYIKKSKVTVVG
ncbi:MAG: ABC transporter ATP-binding protein [Lachnospiraceae bacterium]|nr:ABC transporter ATP-binding protein [Oribacterium sp.]MDY6317874.1 ABC transporter ATP-binding protein [Oribacterium sp.]MEE3461962.1 ABC transporter ATP-binding protein [Lachnospiraceae bacterium]